MHDRKMQDWKCRTGKGPKLQGGKCRTVKCGTNFTLWIELKETQRCAVIVVLHLYYLVLQCIDYSAFNWYINWSLSSIGECYSAAVSQRRYFVLMECVTKHFNTSLELWSSLKSATPQRMVGFHMSRRQTTPGVNSKLNGEVIAWKDVNPDSYMMHK